MSKKTEIMHIRVDPELKAALKKLADRFDRKDTDQARYILRMALGLIPEEKEDYRAQEETQRSDKEIPALKSARRHSRSA